MDPFVADDRGRTDHVEGLVRAVRQALDAELRERDH
jgi:hypothetical protein